MRRKRMVMQRKMRRRLQLRPAVELPDCGHAPAACVLACASPRHNTHCCDVA